jgi:transposase
MILTPSRAVRVFAYPAAADLRKGYDGLYGLVQSGLKADPMSGDLFLFVNESRKLCKVLLWDSTGLCIFQKRLERGCFAKLWRDDGQVVRLTQSELALSERVRAPSTGSRGWRLVAWRRRAASGAALRRARPSPRGSVCVEAAGRAPGACDLPADRDVLDGRATHERLERRPRGGMCRRPPPTAS